MSDQALFDLPCIIFAGGKSSRMGRDKALLPFGETPTLAQYQYARLAPLFTQTCVSVKTPDALPGALPTLPDDPRFKDAAPTVGFITLFTTLDAERAFVLSVDAPFVHEAVIASLLRSDREGLDAVIARTPGGIHPLCGIYHRSLLPTFESMAETGDHALGKMLRTKKVVYVDFDDETRFANLNHPHEYDAALKRVCMMKDEG